MEPSHYPCSRGYRADDYGGLTESESCAITNLTYTRTHQSEKITYSPTLRTSCSVPSNSPRSYGYAKFVCNFDAAFLYDSEHKFADVNWRTELACHQVNSYRKATINSCPNFDGDATVLRTHCRNRLRSGRSRNAHVSV